MLKRDPSRLVIDVLHKTDYFVSRKKNTALEPYGVTMYQAMSLIYIAQHEDSMDINQRAIERYTKLSNPGVSKLINVLEDLGYVERTTDPSDARSHLLRSTESGREHAAIFLKVIEQADKDITAPLSSEEYAQLKTLLGKLTGHQSK